MAVLGYASATSVEQGGTINLHLKNEGRPAAVDLVLEQIGNPANSQSLTVALERDDGPATSDPILGFGWPVSVTVAIPLTWPSGMYKLRHGDHNTLNFVVRAADPGSTSKVLFQVSYLTPAAYNSAGGKSFYKPDDNALRARKVSFDRPGSSPEIVRNGASADSARFVEWLHAEAIPVEYCSNIDLHADAGLLDHYDCMIIGFHDEYWTKPMRDHCERFVGNGGNLIVFSGNTCFRQVRLEDDDRTVVFYKFAKLDHEEPRSDRQHPQLDETAIAWAEPPVNRPQNTMLGVGFTEGAFGFGRDEYTIRFPEHWVFGGVDAGTPLPVIHYETDAAAFIEEPEGYPRVTGEEQTPLGVTVLATADLRDWNGKPGRATMTIHSRNGTVFNAATTDWFNHLGRSDAVDTITRNVLTRLRSRLPQRWEHIGHANRGCGLAATAGRLYIATEQNKLWRRHPVGADVAWREIGHADGVTSMAGNGGQLFCITAGNRLWQREAIDADTDWQHIGDGPGNSTRALAAVGGMLYAIDQEGRLQQRATSGPHVGWKHVEILSSAENPRHVPATPTITAMTSYGNILIAATTDDRLLRTNTDWINESDGWQDIHHCERAVGLAMVDWMLFVATSDHQLWRMDLWGLSNP